MPVQAKPRHTLLTLCHAVLTLAVVALWLLWGASHGAFGADLEVWRMPDWVLELGPFGTAPIVIVVALLPIVLAGKLEARQAGLSPVEARDLKGQLAAALLTALPPLLGPVFTVIGVVRVLRGQSPGAGDATDDGRVLLRSGTYRLGSTRWMLALHYVVVTAVVNITVARLVLRMLPPM